MRNIKQSIQILVIIAVMFLSIIACDQLNKLAPMNTPDLCSKENILEEVGKIEKFMGEFDDIKFVANLTQQEQLAGPILELQKVRRQVEYLKLPSCLDTLKSSTIEYMDNVIIYLAYFMGGSARELVDDGINNSQNSRISYEKELASLLGVDFVPSATETPLALLPSSAATSVPDQAGEPMLVVNPGTQQVNIRMEPYIDASIIGYLQSAESAVAVGRTESSEWIAVLLPGVEEPTLGWIYAEVVVLNVLIETLPTSEPIPTVAP